jgi:hypothetical protein
VFEVIPFREGKIERIEDFTDHAAALKAVGLI